MLLVYQANTAEMGIKCYVRRADAVFLREGSGLIPCASRRNARAGDITEGVLFEIVMAQNIAKPDVLIPARVPFALLPPEMRPPLLQICQAIMPLRIPG